MAIMIPGMETKEDFNFSGGELLLYELLRQLPDDYYVFHSTHWNEQRRRSEYSARKYVQWGEADFTIFHPSYGFIVFEVKDGLISFSRERGWIQTNRSNGMDKTIDPMDQAERSKYYFLDRIKARFGGQSPYTFCSAVWFTAGDRANIEGNLPLNYKEEIVLWSNDLQSVAAAEMAIRRIYRFYDVRKVEPSEEMTSKVLDTLAPEFGVVQTMRSRTLAAKALFRRMTTEQMYLLDYLEEQEEAAIHGVAGTGKTVLAIQKAKNLAQTDCVLFLCFNRFLKTHLEETCPDSTNISFFTLDGLVGAFTGAFTRLPDERTDTISEFLMDWDEYELPFKHIVVDEGQDFADIHLQLLHDIAQAHHGNFYVFYDRNQFVQGLRYPEWLDKMDCRLVLSRNCRNTKEIAITSTRPIGIDENRIRMRRESAVGGTIKPNLFFAEDKSILKEYLCRLIRKYISAGLAGTDIVVLSMKPEGKSILTEDDFRLSGGYMLTKDKNSNGILFTTVRKFKGLEAMAVICIDIDSETFENDRKRNIFYVGTSRAMSYLNLITTASPEELAATITGNDNYLKRPQAIKAIRDSLRVKIASENDL
ncbi:nuclease-related domain-containing DEAD/DEAH box helicase [Muriventricola aceti]|uniref:nuclease-related domain-containing DEAD/DEAH box helicase n=1 Tax=Muriventricola aceti TaxID=2981773 RepID=UPI000820E263|nr:nuclease-related domain-containing DEAD/DEAH box helicase [Muriventricola aceti]MCU6703026.1 ATP-binding domain-containing protein [Muriventricola aceti]SCJ30178.1 Superfamily I DNA and RNA helicases [uncultured Flavonifractor sp.]